MNHTHLSQARRADIAIAGAVRHRCYTQVEHRRFLGPKGRHSLCRWCKPPDDLHFFTSFPRAIGGFAVDRSWWVKGNAIRCLTTPARDMSALRAWQIDLCVTTTPDDPGIGCADPSGLKSAETQNEPPGCFRVRPN